MRCGHDNNISDRVTTIISHKVTTILLDEVTTSKDLGHNGDTMEGSFFAEGKSE